MNILMKLPIFFILILFVSGSIFGIYAGMATQDGQMFSCPFMGGMPVLCQMSAIEHLAAWQQAFVGIAQDSNVLLLMLILNVAMTGLAIRFFHFVKLTRLALALHAYSILHKGELPDPLLLAFSKGILKPKIYEAAALPYVNVKSFMNYYYEHKNYFGNRNSNNSTLGYNGVGSGG